MKLYVEDFYNSFKDNKQYEKINKDLIYKYINTICSLNNILIFPNKLKIPLVFFIKKNIDIRVINIILYKKIIHKISHNISLLVYSYTVNKWMCLIHIAMNNGVEKQLLDYFFNLYETYLLEEQQPKLYVLQAKHLSRIRLKRYGDFKNYISLNIINTIPYIDIIFSKLSTKYLILSYIFN